MRLLEVTADRLIVLRGIADLRADPVGQSRVQLGARALQEPPVRGVADQNVMEAKRRLAEEPARVALDQLAPVERLETGVEVGAVPLEQGSDGASREMPADDRGTLEHGALFGAESLDARGKERMDRRRHLERGQPRADDPTVTFAGERALLHQHADELADEERIALAGGEHLRRDGR